MRLGPFYFVPQIASRPGHDPWAHRKGEPRPFVLMWAVFLMVGALLTIFAVRSLTVPTTAQFVAGCRSMLALTLIGACVLWPMVRLSQRFPDNIPRAVFIDALAILAPAQAVVWPMPFLTHWGWDVNGAVALVIIGWTLGIGALLAFAHGSPAPASRACWMLGFLLLFGAGPMVLVAIASTGHPAPVEALAWANPITTIYRLTSAPSGVSPAMSFHEWVGAVCPLLGAAALWTLHAASPSRPVLASHSNAHAPTPIGPGSIPGPDDATVERTNHH